MDAELGDYTRSMEMVQDREGTERLAEGFLEANRLLAKERNLVMSAKQLRRVSCTARWIVGSGALSRVDMGCCGVVVSWLTFIYRSCRYGSLCQQCHPKLESWYVCSGLAQEV